jgi:hypothetical protein
MMIEDLDKEIKTRVAQLAASARANARIDSVSQVTPDKTKWHATDVPATDKPVEEDPVPMETEGPENTTAANEPTENTDQPTSEMMETRKMCQKGNPSHLPLWSGHLRQSQREKRNLRQFTMQGAPKSASHLLVDHL